MGIPTVMGGAIGEAMRRAPRRRKLSTRRRPMPEYLEDEVEAVSAMNMIAERAEQIVNENQTATGVRLAINAMDLRQQISQSGSYMNLTRSTYPAMRLSTSSSVLANTYYQTYQTEPAKTPIEILIEEQEALQKELDKHLYTACQRKILTP